MKKARIPRKKKKYFLSKPVLQWVRKLNKYARRIGYKHQVISDKLDFECWIDYYHDGYSPVEAFNEDMSCAL